MVLKASLLHLLHLHVCRGRCTGPHVNDHLATARSQDSRASNEQASPFANVQFCAEQSNTMWKPTVLLAAALAVPAQALHFFIDGAVQKCFFEELPKDTLVVGMIPGNDSLLVWIRSDDV